MEEFFPTTLSLFASVACLPDDSHPCGGEVVKKNLSLVLFALRWRLRTLNTFPCTSQACETSFEKDPVRFSSHCFALSVFRLFLHSLDIKLLLDDYLAKLFSHYVGRSSTLLMALFAAQKLLKFNSVRVVSSSCYFLSWFNPVQRAITNAQSEMFPVGFSPGASKLVVFFFFSSFVHIHNICNICEGVYSCACVRVHAGMHIKGFSTEPSEAHWLVSANYLQGTVFPVWGLWMCTSVHSFVVVIYMWVLGKNACVTSLPSPLKVSILLKVLTHFEFCLLQRHLHIHFTIALFTITTLWNWLWCPSVDRWIKRMWHINTIIQPLRMKLYHFWENGWNLSSSCSLNQASLTRISIPSFLSYLKSRRKTKEIKVKEGPWGMWEGKGGGEIRTGPVVVNKMEVHYVHIWKCHHEFLYFRQLIEAKNKCVKICFSFSISEMPLEITVVQSWKPRT